MPKTKSTSKAMDFKKFDSFFYGLGAVLFAVGQYEFFKTASSWGLVLTLIGAAIAALTYFGWEEIISRKIAAIKKGKAGRFSRSSKRIQRYALKAKGTVSPKIAKSRTLDKKEPLSPIILFRL